jgi:hypothetical protein
LAASPLQAVALYERLPDPGKYCRGSIELRNDKVTAYNVIVPPGEGFSSGGHTLLVFLDAGSIEITVMGKSPETSRVSRGEIKYIDTDVWTLRNTAKSSLHCVDVLFVRSRSSEMWGKDDLAQPGYTPVLENGYVRVYRFELPAHSNVTQQPLKDCLIVCLRGAEVLEYSPGGRKEAFTFAADRIEWLRSGARQQQNAGNSLLSLIAVEPK